MAGALADQGKLPAAIELLERGAGHPRRAQLHHLKQWYALADLYDRAVTCRAPARCSLACVRPTRHSPT